PCLEGKRGPNLSREFLSFRSEKKSFHLSDPEVRSFWLLRNQVMTDFMTLSGGPDVFRIFLMPRIRIASASTFAGGASPASQPAPLIEILTYFGAFHRTVPCEPLGT